MEKKEPLKKPREKKEEPDYFLAIILGVMTLLVAFLYIFFDEPRKSEGGNCCVVINFRGEDFEGFPFKNYFDEREMIYTYVDRCYNTYEEARNHTLNLRVKSQIKCK